MGPGQDSHLLRSQRHADSGVGAGAHRLANITSRNHRAVRAGKRSVNPAVQSGSTRVAIATAFIAPDVSPGTTGHRLESRREGAHFAASTATPCCAIKV